jgi:hypothetical protein
MRRWIEIGYSILDIRGWRLEVGDLRKILKVTYKNEVCEIVNFLYLTNSE